LPIRPFGRLTLLKRYLYRCGRASPPGQREALKTAKGEGSEWLLMAQTV
jgi:hypothetical protein